MTDSRGLVRYRRVYERGLRVLLEVYPIAKENLLFYETHEQVKAISALTDLRDVLDHLAMATALSQGQGEGDEDTIEKRIEAHLISAEEHLRRAAIEPLELAVEDRLYRVLHKIKWGKLSRMAFQPGVASDEALAAVEQAKALLCGARLRKGETAELSQAVAALREAYEVLEVPDRAGPSVEVMKGRLISIPAISAAFAVGAIVAVIIDVLFAR